MGALVTAAIVLAGGRATRLGGADKPRVMLGGATLLDRTLSAIGEVTAAPIIVGPQPPGESDSHRYRYVREEPAFAGPASALAAGVAALASLPPEAIVTVLPCDLVHPHEAVAALASWDADAPADDVPVDGAMLFADGRRQWTSIRARLGALRRAAAGVAPNAALRGMLGALTLTEITVPASAAADLDTLEQLRAAGAKLPDARPRPEAPARTEAPACPGAPYDPKKAG